MPKSITIAGETFKYFEKIEWGSRATSAPTDPVSDGPEPQGYLHHEGAGHNRPTITRPLTLAEEKAWMRAWQDYSIDRAGQGWSDIPYNIGVFPFSGNVYEARGWRFKSGATLGQNEDSKTVCILGNIVPGAQGIPEAVNSAALAMVWGVTLGEISPKAKILGHRENPKHLNATTCPGSIDLNVFRSLVKSKLDKYYNPKPPQVIQGPAPNPKPIPDFPEENDVSIVIAAPSGSNARFLATADSKGFISNMTWISEEEDAKRLSNYYRTVEIEPDASRNIGLIGPVPRGDTLRNWTIDDFLNASG